MAMSAKANRTNRFEKSVVARISAVAGGTALDVRTIRKFDLLEA